MGDDIISSRTPEGPLNYCRVCGAHCRIEPSVPARDATCPRCGSLLWFEHRRNLDFGTPGQRGAISLEPLAAAPFWEPGTGPNAKIWMARPTITTAEVLTLEARLGIQLPRFLADGLLAQNGGRLLGTEIDIYPAEYFATLNEGRWVDLALVAIPDRAMRERMVCVGTAPGGSVILDYRHRNWEPGAQILDLIFDGEARADFASFDAMVRESVQRHAREV